MKPSNHQIDDIIRDWAQRRAIDPERLERIRQTARDRLAARRPYHHRTAHRCGRLILSGAVAAAAALLIIARVWTSPEPQALEITGTCDAGTDDIGSLFSRADSDRATVLADSLQQLFAHEWRWVAQSDGNIEIETVASNLMSGQKTTRSALVRLVVMKRPRGENEWQTAWETDILMRSEDFLDFKPDPTLANRLQLWVYPIDDGKVAIDTGVELECPIQVTTQSQHLVNQGSPVEILALTTDAAEYRVMQAVVLLDLLEG